MRDGRPQSLRRTALGLCLLGACQVLWQPPADATDATFARVLASSDKRQLTEWARRYQHGEGVAPNLDNAIRLYCKAARKGDVDAQYYLGYIYASGAGVRRDEELAAAWLHLAAQQNDPQSQTHPDPSRLREESPRDPPPAPYRTGATRNARAPSPWVPPAPAKPRAPSPIWRGIWPPITSWTPIWSWP